jgi:hypothetical protein
LPSRRRQAAAASRGTLDRRLGLTRVDVYFAERCREWIADVVAKWGLDSLPTTFRFIPSLSATSATSFLSRNHAVARPVWSPRPAMTVGDGDGARRRGIARADEGPGGARGGWTADASVPGARNSRSAQFGKQLLWSIVARDSA